MGTSAIKALVVDDDEDMRATLKDFLAKMGINVRTTGNVGEAERLLYAEVAPFDLILADLKLPGGSGLDIVKAAHARCSESLVTIITGYASLETAVEAIRLGAYNYITKPFSLDEIGVQVRNMIERISLSKENARLSVRLQELYKELSQLQSERADFMRLLDEIRQELQGNNHKLNQLLHLRLNGSTPQQMLENHSDKAVLPPLIPENDSSEKLRRAVTASVLDLED